MSNLLKEQGEGLLLYFLTPFFPRTGFKRLQESKSGYYVLAVVIEIFISTLLYKIVSDNRIARFNEKFAGLAELNIEYIAFYFGALTRLFIISYGIWVISRRSFKEGLKYTYCFNIIAISALPLNLGLSARLMDSIFSSYASYIGILWSYGLIAFGVWYISGESKYRATITVIGSALILWLVRFPFFGFDL